MIIHFQIFQNFNIKFVAQPSFLCLILLFLFLVVTTKAPLHSSFLGFSFSLHHFILQGVQLYFLFQNPFLNFKLFLLKSDLSFLILSLLLSLKDCCYCYSPNFTSAIASAITLEAPSLDPPLFLSTCSLSLPQHSLPIF